MICRLRNCETEVYRESSGFQGRTVKFAIRVFVDRAERLEAYDTHPRDEGEQEKALTSNHGTRSVAFASDLKLCRFFLLC